MSDSIGFPELPSLDLEGWTASSLAETYFKHQMAVYEQEQHNTAKKSGRISSLFSLCAARILEDLAISDNLATDVQTLVHGLETTVLQRLLRDARTPYHVIHAFGSIPPDGSGESVDASRSAIDVDEAILLNDSEIRSSMHDQANKYLVTIDGMVRALTLDFHFDGESSQESNKKVARSLSTLHSPATAEQLGLFTYRRKDPPLGGIELFDKNRKRVLRMQPSDTSFATNFNYITNHALRGLDWTNVFMAGSMALASLLHADTSTDWNSADQCLEINLYLYGLGAAEANQKVEEIYDVWDSNVPASSTEKRVAKNRKNITFYADSRYHRVQILFTLFSSPTHVLSSFELDVCAIGFDGSRLYMLPRCARALETGYSVFSMALIEGKLLSNRWAIRKNLLFDYADRGFGLRILPSYIQGLGNGISAELLGREYDHHKSHMFGFKTLQRLECLARKGIQGYKMLHKKLHGDPFGLCGFYYLVGCCERWHSGINLNTLYVCCGDFSFKA